jgi:hypothetical protein
MMLLTDSSKCKTLKTNGSAITSNIKAEIRLQDEFRATWEDKDGRCWCTLGMCDIMPTKDCFVGSRKVATTWTFRIQYTGLVRRN